jgi:phosphatidylinositol 4-kinase
MARLGNREGTDRDAIDLTGKLNVDHITHLLTQVKQHYLRESRDTLLLDQVEMGAGLAMQYSKAIPRSDRQECKCLTPAGSQELITHCIPALMPRIGGWVSDSANLLASQFAAKNYFSGELSGARWAMEQGV